jgi:hypothetical protein
VLLQCCSAERRELKLSETATKGRWERESQLKKLEKNKSAGKGRALYALWITRTQNPEDLSLKYRDFTTSLASTAASIYHWLRSSARRAPPKRCDGLGRASLACTCKCAMCLRSYFSRMLSLGSKTSTKGTYVHVPASISRCRTSASSCCQPLASHIS